MKTTFKIFFSRTSSHLSKRISLLNNYCSKNNRSFSNKFNQFNQLNQTSRQLIKFYYSKVESMSSDGKKQPEWQVPIPKEQAPVLKIYNSLTRSKVPNSNTVLYHSIKKKKLSCHYCLCCYFFVLFFF